MFELCKMIKEMVIRISSRSHSTEWIGLKEKRNGGEEWVLDRREGRKERNPQRWEGNRIPIWVTPEICLVASRTLGEWVREGPHPWASSSVEEALVTFTPASLLSPVCGLVIWEDFAAVVLPFSSLLLRIGGPKRAHCWVGCGPPQGPPPGWESLPQPSMPCNCRRLNLILGFSLGNPCAPW